MSPEAGKDTNNQVDPKLFRKVCGQFATGITVVTVTDRDGQPHGLTVNSFASISLNPLLVMVSISLRSSVLPHLQTHPGFAVNVLADHQEAVSRVFATPAAQRFEGLSWRRSEMGVPLLDGCLAQLECSTVQNLDVGDHKVFIGEVKRATFREGKPLIYFNSCYQNLV